jgi:uncharacterized protein YcfJ
MSHNKLRAAMTLVLLSASTLGAQAADFEDYGRVLSVSPQVEQFNQPRQECRDEYVQTQRQPQQRSVGGGIIGGIAGGLLGNQVGGGNGRTAATAAGAIAGALTGDRLDNDRGQAQPQTEVRRQCRNVDNWESRTNGYSVTYEYHGRNFTSVLPYDPGQRVRLHVAVTPRP